MTPTADFTNSFNEDNLLGNNRAVQPLGDRTLYQKLTENTDDAATTLLASAAAITIGLLAL